PISNTVVEIQAVPPTRQPHPIFVPMTDADGRFHFDNLEMGQYVLGFNLRTPPYAHDWYGKRVPYDRSFYPGVADRSKATIVTLESSRDVNGLEFRLPPVLNPVIIRGRVIAQDGSPVRATVSLLDLDYLGETAQVDTVRTSADGIFGIQGAEGRRY